MKKLNFIFGFILYNTNFTFRYTTVLLYCTVTSDIKKQDICIERFTVSKHSCTKAKIFPPSMTFKILELSGERKQL